MAELVRPTLDGVELLVTLFINIRTTETRSAVHRSSAAPTGEGLPASSVGGSQSNTRPDPNMPDGQIRSLDRARRGSDALPPFGSGVALA